ncbi:HAD family hydrolase [Streptomyces gamaensis]|uniref:HAD family hydrolase n=1 Tax=Streptomyces gamaensis TaxID=1763542 RepID=A0ABW0YYI6_9ACTN
MAAQLVLWDIDHTLLDTRGVGRRLFASAFHRATGRVMDRPTRIDGLTERVIFRETAKRHGLAPSPQDFDTFARALAYEHRLHVAELGERGRALPGAAAVLGALARLPGISQTVVTGNIRATAEIKLAAFGLERHLNLGIGAYGEDHEERVELVRTALDRAGCSARDAVLLGDTPADVRAGLGAGVRVLAVATGRSTLEELRAAGADAAVPDLRDTGGIVRTITGGEIP